MTLLRFSSHSSYIYFFMGNCSKRGKHAKVFCLTLFPVLYEVWGSCCFRSASILVFIVFCASCPTRPAGIRRAVTARRS